jgi:hypothetical protein
MREELLWYIWQYRRFRTPLKLCDGREITVIKPGIRNTYSGPDYFEAQVFYEDKTWAGNVELHIKSSDFLKHGHQLDAAYNSLILHVVWEHDTPIDVLESAHVPTLELCSQADHSLLHNFENLLGKKQVLLCSQLLPEVSGVHYLSWIDRMSAERLERKGKEIAAIRNRYVQDWEQTLYHLLLEGFGMKANKHAFALVAGYLPFGVVKKHSRDTEEIRALLESVSNLKLGASKENAVFFKRKYGLHEIGNGVFKTGGVRPPNQPDMRMKQLAVFLTGKENLVADILNCIEQQGDVFESFAKNQKPGEDFMRHIYINVVIPFGFYYAVENRHDSLREAIMAYFSALPPEQNKYTKMWTAAGRKAQSALESQAQLESLKFYCSLKKCLLCHIGINLLNK